MLLGIFEESFFTITITDFNATIIIIMHTFPIDVRTILNLYLIITSCFLAVIADNQSRIGLSQKHLILHLPFHY